MPALSFDPRRLRPILRGRHRYVLVETAGRRAMVDATCRHRGGPLDLGDVVGSASGAPLALRCPWHQRCQPFRALFDHSLPMVIRDDVAGTAIIPEDEPDHVEPDRPSIVLF